MTNLNIDDLTLALRRSLKARRRSQHTVIGYERAIRRFHDWLCEEGRGAAFPWQVTKQDIEGFTASLVDAGLADASIRHFFASLRSVFSWLEEDADREWKNPFYKLKPPAMQESVKDVVDIPTAKKVIESLEKDGKFRDAAVIALMFDTGARASEVAGIRIEDLDWEKATVILTDTKNGDVRRIPMSEPVAARIDRVIRRRGNPKAGPLWVGKKGPLTYWGIYGLVKDAFAAHGVNGISPHDLRHSFATNYMDGDGAQLDTLQTIGGWKGSEMARKYSRQGQERRALAAHARLSPLGRV